ncbi:MAG: bifunctional phosphoribosyl-AMP cyclohydrolase/phosphoribosyl-ATP diphosphatase HisIE [Deltaproteobacteria bacterium]|nr:bifunctional phosphoribosyl-AMP cyclohydrolase/phosphoribosyl-ATP diphosphatase HisIE [Deltaproteobacteria bacterium]
MESEISWNEAGLVPAVAIDAASGAFLMMAWMNRESLQATRDSQQATFYSRSRQRLWRKGETSGNTMLVREIRLDCDGDTLVLEVVPKGPACHTGKPSCAYRRVDGDELVEDQGPIGAPAAVLDRVSSVAFQRSMSTAEKSYTKSLFDGGWEKIIAKLREETGELIDELPAGEDKAVVGETADLLFHLIVALTGRGIATARVWAELERRFGTSGHDEKRGRDQQ